MIENLKDRPLTPLEVATSSLAKANRLPTDTDEQKEYRADQIVFYSLELHKLKSEAGQDRAKKERLHHSRREKEINKKRYKNKREFYTNDAMFSWAAEKEKLDAKKKLMKKKKPHKRKNNNKHVDTLNRKQETAEYQERLAVSREKKRERRKAAKLLKSKVVPFTESSILDEEKNYPPPDQFDQEDEIERLLRSYHREEFSTPGLDIAYVVDVLATFIYQMKHSHNKTSMLVAANSLMNSILGTNKYLLAADLAHKLADAFASQLTSESFIDSFNKMLSSKVWKICVSFVLTVVSLKWLNRSAAVTIISLLGKPSKKPLIETFSDILNGMSYLLEGIQRVWSGESFSDVFFSEENNVYDYVKLCKIAVDDFDQVTFGIINDGDIDPTVYVTRCRDLISKGELFMLDESLGSCTKGLVEQQMNALKKCKRLTVTSVSAASRTPPYAICIHGPPKIGKSVILKVVQQAFCEVYGYEYNPGVVFQKPKSSSFYDGYDYSQFILHFPEVGNTKPEYESSSVNELDDINKHIDGSKLRLDFAYEGGKGKMFSMFKLVMVDTNFPDMNITAKMMATGPLKRRFTYMSVEVLPDFREEGSTALDIDKSIAAGGCIYDRYRVRLYKHNLNGNAASNEVNIHQENYVSLPEAILILKQEFAEHAERQAEVEKAVSDQFDEIKVESLMTEIKNYDWKGTFSTFAVYYAMCVAFGSPAIYALMPFVLTYLTGSMFYAFLMFVSSVILLCVILEHSDSFVLSLVTSASKQYWKGKRLDRKLLLARIKSAAYKRVGKNIAWRNVGIVASAIVALECIRRFFTVSKFFTESGEHLLPDREKGKVEEIEDKLGCGNSYTRVKVKNTTQWNNATRVKNLSVHRGPPQELWSRVSKNTRYCTVCVEKDGRSIKAETYVLGICSSYAVINTHALLNCNKGKIIFPVSRGLYEGGKCREILFNEENVVHLGGDITGIRLSGLQFSDIRKHFTPDTLKGDFYKGIVFGENITAVPTSEDISVVNQYSNVVLIKPLKYVSKEHAVGMCGNPVILSRDGGSAICAIHAAGSDLDVCFGAPLNQNLISSIVSSFDNSPLEHSIQVHSQSSVYEIDYQEPVVKSAFRFEYLPGVEYFGKAPGNIMMNKKSKLVRTEFADKWISILEDEFKIEDWKVYTRPPMKPFFREGGYVSMWNINLRKMAEPPVPMDPNILKVVVKKLSSRIIGMLQERGVSTLQPLTLDSALNGASSDDFINSINDSTSAGFGFSGTKRDHLDLNWDFNSKTMYPSSALDDRLRQVIDMYVNGESCGFIHRAALKDEARPIEKAIKGKTRVFFMSPLDNLLVARMFLAPFYSLLAEHNDIFYTSIGVDMHREASSVIGPIRSHSSLGFAGDYGSYDTSMPVDVSLAVAKVVENVLEFFGYNDVSLKIVRGLFTDSSFPCVEMLQDIFMRPGLQPSGKYATAEDNSMRGLVLLMYTFEKRCPGYDFFQEVVARTYGDDVIGSVSGDVIDRFNNISHQEEMGKLGIKFTDPEKNDDMRKYVSIDSLEFLKREFVYREGMCVAPLAVDSIRKMYEWRMPSAYVSNLDLDVSTGLSALYEIYFHAVDNVQYDRIRDAMIVMLSDVYSVPPVFFDEKFPLYGDLFADVIKIGNTGVLDTRNHQPATEVDESELCSLKLDVVGDEEEKRCSPTEIIERDHCGNSRVYSAVYTESYYKQAEEKLYGSNFVDGEMKTITDIFEDITNPSGNLRDYQLVLEKAEKLLSGEIKRRAIPFTAEEVLRGTIRMRYDIGPRTEENLRLLVRYAETVQTLDAVKKLNSKSVLPRVRLESAVYEAKAGVPEVGDDTRQNFGDVAGQEIDEKYNTLSVDDRQGQEGTLDVDGFFSRPVEIANFSVAPGATVDQRFRVWDLYSLQPSVRAKMRNFSYMRGNLHVRIAISGTPFHYGRMLASYQPMEARNENLTQHLSNYAALGSAYRPLILNYLSQSKEAVVLDVKENRPVEIVCPYIATKPMFRLFNVTGGVISDVTSLADFENAGTLYMYSINAMASVSATPSDLSVQIVAWMEDVELGPPTGTQITVTTESDVHDERETGPVEKFASGAADISSRLSTVPLIGPYAKASELGFGALSEVAALFGWSRPVLIREPAYVKNRPFTNGSNGIGSGTEKRVTFDPKQELTVSPDVVGVDEDELVFQSISSRKTYLTSFNWDPSDATLTSPIWICKVSPQLDTIYTDPLFRLYQPTAMSFAARPFEYWRGSIKYRFEFVASAYHRGKVAIFFEPNVNQNLLINSNLSTNKQFMQVVDLQQTQTIDVCVNWAYPRAWAHCVPLGAEQNNEHEFTVNFSYEFVNGYIAVVPFTELQSPDSSSIPVNVYVSCDDLMLNQMRSSVPDSRVFVESAVYEERLSTVDVECYDLNDSTASTDHICENHFGERPVSFRPLLKRFVNTAVTNILAAAPTATENFSATFRNIPSPLAPYSSTISDNEPNLFGYLRYAFVGMRGGMKKRVRFFSSERNPDNLARVIITLTSPSSAYPSNVLSYSLDAVRSSMNGSVSFVPHTNGGVECEIPFYTNNTFVISFSEDMIGANNLGEMDLSWTKSYTVQYEIDARGSTENYALEESAVGEDFTFLRFQGAPLHRV